MILIKDWLLIVLLLFPHIWYALFVIWDRNFNVGIVFLFHLTHLYLFDTQLLNFWTFSFINLDSTNWLIKIVMSLCFILDLMLPFILKRWITLALMSFLTVTGLLFLSMRHTRLHNLKVVLLVIVTSLASLLHMRHSDRLDHGPILLVKNKLLSSLDLIIYALLDKTIHELNWKIGVFRDASEPSVHYSSVTRGCHRLRIYTIEELVSLLIIEETCSFNWIPR